jgi:hypothetical protein
MSSEDGGMEHKTLDLSNRSSWKEIMSYSH